MSGNNPWAWAGLLKWSLNYADGTKENKDLTPMSAEDKAFLEAVMRDGIVDEGDRMKAILTEASKAMEYYQSVATQSEDIIEPPITEEALKDLLQELRDVVEQIDYARAFCSLQGIPFLLGCVQELAVPESIRLVSLGILATIGQNNPPVQQQLIEMGALKTLSDLFFAPTTTDAVKAKTMQSMSSVVRNHEVAETVFCSLPQAPELFLVGLNPKSESESLKSKCLFFLRALVTSDLATQARLRSFQEPIAVVRDIYLSDIVSPDLREMSIALLEQLLVDRKGGARIILQTKDNLAAQGVLRITALRALTGEKQEFAQEELSHWESFMVLLARAEPEEETKEDEPQKLAN